MEDSYQGGNGGKMGVWTVVKAVVRLILILFNNFTAIPAYLMLMLILRPLVWFGARGAKVYWIVEGFLFRYLLIQVDYWGRSAGYTVEEVGDDITPCLTEPTLLISNHQSTGDVPILMTMFANHQGWGDKVYWIMDTLFKYTQFGFVSQVHGDFFIQQGRDTRGSQLSSLQQHLTQVFHSRERQCIVLFPEGGFLRKRRARSKEYGLKHGFPVLEHVTLPRIGAMLAILHTLGDKNDEQNHNSHVTNSLPQTATNYISQPQSSILNGHSKTTSSKNGRPKTLRWLLDVTIAYPEARPLDLFCVLFGHRPPCKTYIHYRKYPIDCVPRDEHGLLNWLYGRYVEKEKLLDDYYCTGKMAGWETGRQLYTNRYFVWCTHLVWTACFFLQCYLLRGIFQSAMDLFV